MSEYANRATKEIIIALAGCVGFADTLVSSEFRNSKRVKRSLAAMLNHAQKALDGIMDGLDQDQVQSILRAANSSVLTVIPKLDPKAVRQYYVCPEDALDTLLSDVLSGCTFCDLEGKEMRRCRKRKALIECGIVSLGSGDCPYAGI